MDFSYLRFISKTFSFWRSIRYIAPVSCYFDWFLRRDTQKSCTLEWVWIPRWHDKSPASRQKKFPSRQKKFPKGLEDFAPFFLLLATPYVMFESFGKKSFLVGKKSFLVGKKSFQRVYRISHLFFCCWPPPMWCLKASAKKVS